MKKKLYSCSLFEYNSMIQKKSIVNTVKRALQTGTFNYVGQQAKQFPPDLFRLQELPLDQHNWWQCVPITKMDFSNNQITVIPQNLTIFPDLQMLRMKNNLVQDVPASLASLQTLKLLDLSKNKISSLPKDYAFCPAIVELNLSQNSLVILPDLSALPTLQILIINDNRLKALPALGQSTKKVQASSNLINQLLINTFRLCSKLQTLILNKNCIEHIEKGTFSKTKSLIALELKQNKLLDFSEMPHSQKLDTIALSFNGLKQFDDFDRCPNLTVLILNDNKLNRISGDIFKLRKLKTLDLSNNNLSDLPSELGFLDSLVRLQLQGNIMRAIRPNIRSGGVNQIKKYLRDRMQPGLRDQIQKKIAPSSQLTSNEHWTKLIQQFSQGGQLVLRGMQLTQIDEMVYSKQLRVLNVSNNKLTQISQEIGQTSTLKSIILNQNELSSLPMRLAHLPYLQTIQAQHNRFTDFMPYHQPFFNSLLHLDLSTNRLTQLPKSILYIPRLRTLLLSYNKIFTIQQVFHAEFLPCLQVLDMSNNQLSSISGDVWNKQTINYLNIQNNNLTKLPTVLGFMSLSGLKVDGNPLKLIKRPIIQKGTVALLDFLRTKHQGDHPFKPQNKKMHFEPQRKPQNQMRIQQHPRQERHQRMRPVQQPQVYSKQAQQQKKALLASLQQEIKGIQYEIDNNMGMNNMKKNDLRKKKQALLIQRNKILKQ